MMRRMLTIPLCLTLLVLGGCGGGDHEDLRAWMKESTKDLKGRVPPLPEVKPYEPVAYDAGSLLDPFKSAKLEPERKKGGGGIQPDFNRPKEPLEGYPLETLKFVGFLQRGKMPNAIIMADSAIYQVKIGNYVGQNFGIITNISETEVSVRELVQDSSGDWVERSSSLLLQEKEATK